MYAHNSVLLDASDEITIVGKQGHPVFALTFRASAMDGFNGRLTVSLSDAQLLALLKLGAEQLRIHSNITVLAPREDLRASDEPPSAA